MCTLSFVPTEDGYLAGMNRDELLTRMAALPPKTDRQSDLAVLYPREPSGGTWIACNGRGNLLALLNWNEIDLEPLGEKRNTRGLVIPNLIGEPDSAATRARLKDVQLDGVFPFRLIGVFAGERKIVEWRWDGHRIEHLEWPWVRKHWFSSSLSDQSAAAERGRICETAARAEAVGSTSWLRGLHRSHEPMPGPFSICVHRRDAATVSYTEVERRQSFISMSYRSRNPCLKENFDSRAILELGEAHAACAS